MICNDHLHICPQPPLPQYRPRGNFIPLIDHCHPMISPIPQDIRMVHPMTMCPSQSECNQMFHRSPNVCSPSSTTTNSCTSSQLSTQSDYVTMNLQSNDNDHFCSPDKPMSSQTPSFYSIASSFSPKTPITPLKNIELNPRSPQHFKFQQKSADYRKKRDKNNEAVRRSRKKTRQKTLNIEKRVRILTDDNEALKKEINLLIQQVDVLRDLLEVQNGANVTT